MKKEGKNKETFLLPKNSKIRLETNERGYIYLTIEYNYSQSTFQKIKQNISFKINKFLDRL